MDIINKFIKNNYVADIAFHVLGIINILTIQLMSYQIKLLNI